MSELDISKLDFEKVGGLIPVVVQDAKTSQVMMLGYMNKEAIDKTLAEKKVTFFSRSKNRLWTKGEVSGNFIDLVDIKVDCDNDTLLVLGNPNGPVCHTGDDTCFGDTRKEKFTLKTLERVIQKRKENPSPDSYTSKLFSTGTPKIAQKVGEEAVESLIEAMKGDKERLREETADLLYHLLVMLADSDVTLNEVLKVLEERHQ
jgi:phosphoribosyl-ATP pyrophosphohydrolase/phosphoribosyl-AMP cyclohydrolase